MIIRNNCNKMVVLESDFYNYLRYNILECADEEVDKMAVQLLLSWVFQITSIYIGFDADNNWLDVSADEKRVRLYNTGIEKALTNQFCL